MITRYGLIDAEGKWYQSGYWRGGTDDQAKAKLYSALGQARAARTRVGGNLRIVKIEAEGVVIDDSEHVAKSSRRRAAKAERAAVREAKWRLEVAERAYNAAEEQLKLARRS